MLRNVSYAMVVYKGFVNDKGFVNGNVVTGRVFQRIVGLSISKVVSGN